MDDVFIFAVVMCIGVIAIVGTAVICEEIVVDDDSNSTNLTVKHSSDDESHVIIPISTGNGITYMVC